MMMMIRCNKNYDDKQTIKLHKKKVVGMEKDEVCNVSSTDGE